MNVLIGGLLIAATVICALFSARGFPYSLPLCILAGGMAGYIAARL